MQSNSLTNIAAHHHWTMTAIHSYAQPITEAEWHLLVLDDVRRALCSVLCFVCLCLVCKGNFTASRVSGQLRAIDGYPKFQSL